MVRWLPCLLLLSLVGCGGDSSPAPSPTPQPPTPSTYTLTGTVSNASSGAGITGATISVLDGANAGKSTTSNGGSFSLTALQPGGFTIRARAQYYENAETGVTVTQNTSTALTMRPIPLFTRSGTGDTVFDMPLHVTRVTITGRYTRNSSNFIVRIAGRLVVNELLGTAWDMTSFSGTYLTSGGVVAITNSSGVQWTFTEVR